MVQAERVPAGADVAGLLGCAIGEPLHRMESVHGADGLPLPLGTAWVSAARFPDLAETFAQTGSITEALRRAGILDYRRHETRITAERVSAEDAVPLAAAPDGLVLVSRALDVDMAGRPLQALRTRFHAERMELVFRH